MSQSLDATFTRAVIQFTIDLWQDLFAKGAFQVMPAIRDVRRRSGRRQHVVHTRTKAENAHFH